MISYRTVSSSCCASRLSSAWRRSRWRLYVQTLTLTCNSRASRAMSADGIRRLRRVTARDASDLAARVMNEPDWMVLQKSNERGNRGFPLARSHMLADSIHELLAVPVLHVFDALTQRPLRRGIALHRVALCPHDVQRGPHHEHRLSRGARIVLAVFGDHLIVTPDSVAPRDPEIQVVVLGARDRCFETTGLPDNRRPEQHRTRHPDVIAEQESDVVVSLDDGFIKRHAVHAVDAEGNAPSCHERDVRMGLETLQADLEGVRQQPVIGVKEDNELAGRMFQTLVSSRALA